MKIGDTILETENDVCLLGMDIDYKLSFQKHISSLCKKASAKLNAIKRLYPKPCEKARKLFINTYVLSNFDYCSIVWHFCGIGDNHKIERINERSLRYIYDDYEHDYFEIIHSKNEPTMYVRRLRKMCSEIWKTLHGTNAKYMIDLLTVRPSPYPSREPCDIYVPKVNQVRFGYNSFKVEGPKIWNMLPREIKEAETLEIFKRKLNTFQFPWCSCENCLTKQTLLILS